MSFEFTLKKLYYKYIDRSAVNHYRLFLLTEEYQHIGRYYFHRFPSSNYDNRDYLLSARKQTQLRKEFFRQRELLCAMKENKDCRICSDSFHDFYVSLPYHYGQYTENILQDLRADIENKK